MLFFQPSALLFLLATPIGLATAQRPFVDFTPLPIEPGTGRIGIVNRNIGDTSPKVVFWIWGLVLSSQYLEFESRTTDGKVEFRLINWHGMSAVDKEGSPMQWGKTEFVAQWGEKGGSTARCHLEGRPAAEGQKQENKMVAFLPGGEGGSYHWPCDYQDCVKVVCADPYPTCSPGGW